jgi:hypothetical protein
MEEKPLIRGCCMSLRETPGIFLSSFGSLMPGGSKWLQIFWNKAAADDVTSVSSETRPPPRPG